jgi:hypothetical protein
VQKLQEKDRHLVPDELDILKLQREKHYRNEKPYDAQDAPFTLEFTAPSLKRGDQHCSPSLASASRDGRRRRVA